MRSAYSDKIYNIAVNTFEVVCYMFPLEKREMEEVPKKAAFEETVQSVVHFSGAAEGKMVVTASGELLTAIAANMLGTEKPDKKQKEGAFCEVVNIICGNTVPLFVQNDKVCYIQPPQIAKDSDSIGKDIEGKEQESLKIFLEEGTVEITVYYLSQVAL